PEGLRAIARYADGVGPEKGFIIPRSADGSLDPANATDFVANAHAAGLQVHPYTFRAENAFLPSNLRSGDDPRERGDSAREIRWFLDTGIDGLFIDRPDVAVEVLHPYRAISSRRSSAVILKGPVPTRCRVTATSPNTLDRLWLTEAIRLREEQAGPLEDSEANRRARAAGGDLAQRIQTRALLLAERHGQLAALRHWRQGARLALLGLLLFGLFAGFGLALAALGDGQRPVNVFWALGSLLGLHLLTLLGWIVGLLLAGDSGGALGRL